MEPLYIAKPQYEHQSPSDCQSGTKQGLLTWTLDFQSALCLGKADLDDHVKVGEFAEVLIGDLAGVGPGGGHQQAMLI